MLDSVGCSVIVRWFEELEADLTTTTKRRNSMAQMLRRSSRSLIPYDSKLSYTHVRELSRLMISSGMLSRRV